MLKQVVLSNFSLYIATAVLQCKYLLCGVMNYIGEPIQAKNNHSKKPPSNNAQAAIVSKRNACQTIDTQKIKVFARVTVEICSRAEVGLTLQPSVPTRSFNFLLTAF